MALLFAVDLRRSAARRFGTVALACPTLLALFILSSSAHAQSVIKRPGEHPDYAAELEPHASLGAFDPPGNTSGTGLGAGLRVTIPIVKNGFIQTINNSVGISFGFDWLHYPGNDASIGPCALWVAGPNGTRICTRIAGPTLGPTDYVFFPVAMQWNFWLHDKFSVFGEPGIVVYYRKAKYEPDSGVGLAPLLDIGGRLHFSQWAALTLRLGYPTLSLGVSFFL